MRWLLSGFVHKEALARGTEREGIREKLSLCPAGACLLIPSATGKVPPNIPASLARYTPALQTHTPPPPLSLQLRVTWLQAPASFWVPHWCLWLLNSSVLRRTNSLSEILSSKYANGLFPS